MSLPTVRLSKHLADDIDRRGIRLADIEAAIATPDRTTPDPTWPELTRSFRAVAWFGGRVPRVVHRPDGADIFVVTAHWDRGAKR